MIDFLLKTIASNKDDSQDSEKNEQVLAGLRVVEEYELEIIEAQKFDKELTIMLKRKA